MDLNHIFLFIAVVSPLLVLVRAWRPGGVFRGWRVAAVIVLVITGATWLLKSTVAGYIGGGAWFLLLFLPTVGLRQASKLAEQGRYESAFRLTALLQWLHPTQQVREQLGVFRSLAARWHGSATDRPESSLKYNFYRRLKEAPVVFLFILINVVVFYVEWRRGALDSPLVMRRLGALDYAEVIGEGEFWRLITALFLHYNVAHLLFNLFALYILGPSLERTIGSIRFATAYLISGIGSTAGVVALTLLKILPQAELVGASGSVMGIVGAWAGFLVRHRHVGQAKQRLLNILLIIGIQIAFDIFTPQVSTSAHLCGVVTGFLVGLYLAPRKPFRAAQ
ncbi:MAG TPA: rhomboid family intramembrane serine protease [Chthoniobacterales bacterium]|nr:rhomboid family intramembrane serine protease [Chthoniobacterales bacterium]